MDGKPPCARCETLDKQIAASLAATIEQIKAARNLETARLLGQIAELLEVLRAR